MMQMLNERAHKNRKETGVMPKIIENPEENILSAARRLVAEQGYAAVTMRAIAKECGIAVGTFYNYYPSKDAMLAVCLLHDWQAALSVPDSAFLAEFTAENVLSWSGEDIAFPQLWTLLERVFIRQAK